jgi:concanavalin A-like lectin/glucanase superfamily protein/Big-like domain-containing protein
MRRLTISAAIVAVGILLFETPSPIAQSGGPAVTGVAGTVAHNQTITISGSSFGTKAVAAPAVWENFDDGTVDGILADGTPTVPNKDNLRHPFATNNARVDFKVWPRQFFEYDGAAAPHWFVQYWIKLASNWHWGTTDTSGSDAGVANVKFFRLHPPGRSYTNVGYAFHSYVTDETMRFTENANEELLPFSLRNVVTPGTWHALQFEYGENTGADRTDGHIRMWIDGQLRHTSDTLITNASIDGAPSDKRPLLVSFWDSWPSSAAPAPMYAYYMDFYIDSSWARVEIGNAASYGLCTLREIQIPTAWSGTSVTVKVNQGAFTNGQTAYLYVVDANGRVNAAGFPVVAGGGSPPPAPDTTPPTVSVTSPVAGATVSGTPTLTASASDNVAVAGVQFKVDGANVGAEDTTAPYTASWPTTSLANGAHTVTAVARDSSGNLGSSVAISVTVSNPLPPPPPPPDTTPPTVSVTGPAAGATVSGTATLTASASDNVAVAGVQFKVDGTNVGAEDTVAPYTASWTTTSIANGAHTVTAVARDSSGNLATSATVSVTVSNAAPPPPPPPVPVGLVASYSFDEGTGATLVDHSGQNNTGTISGATWTTAGRFGSALAFDGVNDWVTVADSVSLDLTSGMTLEAWVYPTAFTAAQSVVLKETPGGLAYSLYSNDSGTPSTWVRLNGALSGNSSVGTSQLPLNTWTHLSATYDGSTMRLFVNGTQVGTRAVAGALTVSTGALHLGGNAVWGEFFTGAIDEVRVYNRALTAAEILSDMSAPVVPPPAPPADTVPPTVSTISPPANAVNVARLANVTAVFSEPMDASTITTSSVELRTAAGALVPTTVSYDATLQRLTMTAASRLLAGSVYRSTIRGGVNGVKDLAGNALAADDTWTFTTIAAPGSPKNVRITK